MPDYKPNQFVRAFAVLALVVALVAVAAVIATSGGGSDSGNDKGAAKEKSEVTKHGRQALDRGIWVVRPGDTLGRIAEETGIDVDTLDEINPKINPQVLLEGQRIKLR